MNLKAILSPFLLLPLSLFVTAQEWSAPDKSEHTPQYTYVEHMPKARYDLGEYISANLHYPDSARKHNIEGRVRIKFVVNKRGRIENCELLEGIGWGCDEEALRVVSQMPPWQPGMNGGKRIKVYFILPITFKLQ